MIRDLGVQQILNVDLSSGRTWVEQVPPHDLLQFLGGRGMNAKLLYERVKAGIDPLGTENVLIIGSGTLTGTNAPSSGRTTISSKGPATGRYFKTSVGGELGAELKYAGYDYLVVTGAAARPSYLWIADGEVKVRDGGHLWGKGTRETDRLVKKELGDEQIQTAVIGIAGENKVLFANIMVCRFNAAGRGGVGAVMGSKNLKAIAVRGTGGLRAAKGKDFFDLAQAVREEMGRDPLADGLHRWGTVGQIEPLNEMGGLAAVNFTRPHLEGAERIGGQYLENQGYLTGRESCFACSIACHRYIQSKEHRYGRFQDSGPELETALSLGSECGIVDTEAVLKGNVLCNDYGLDTISTGHAIAWAMECGEKGLLTGDRLEGLKLSFGNAETMLELIRKIAAKKGYLGRLLAQGTKRAAEEVGGDSWKWAIQFRGLEQSACDTRTTKGYALAFSLNPRGPDHLHTECIAEFGMTEEARDVVRKVTGDEKYAVPTMPEKRAEIVTWHEEVYAASDALGFCAFSCTACYNVNPERMARWLSLATGLEISEELLMEAGRRIITLERCFNVREGHRREEDRLPWRMMNEPVSDGPGKGLVTDQKMLEGMQDEYFALNEWDITTGIPKRKTLERLGLGELCHDCASLVE